jgi:hypothetical protein
VKRAELVESILVFACIPTLWPVAQSLREGTPLPSYYGLVLGGALVVLVVVAVRRARRIRDAFRARDRRPPFPPSAGGDS